MLRTNRRPRPSLPSGDVLTPQEITCVNQYHAYGEAYNRAFARLDGRAFDRTCSAMTLEEARRQFGSVDETISDLKR